MVMNEGVFALEAVDIHKSFFGNHVLKGVDLAVRPGEVLGLVGSNGAGKSTLMKIINGVYSKDSGTIRIQGKEVDFKDARDARDNGVAMVYQEFSLIPTMTVYENLFLGIEFKKNGLIDTKACVTEAEAAFMNFGVSIDVHDAVEDLSTGNQQIVEIVKAMMHHPAILILDEPTASLTHKEIDLLFAFIQNLRNSGVAIFMISHHMNEIMRICNRVIVLRNGELVLDKTIGETSISEMVQAMIGRKLADNVHLPPKSPIRSDEIVMSVKDLSVKGCVHEVSFDLCAGEILGIAGLLGSGRTELMKAIYGLLPYESGTVHVKGKLADKEKPWTQIEKGVFLVPENRRESGIVGMHTIHENMVLPIWKRFAKGVFVDEVRTRQSAQTMKERLSLKATGIEQTVESLSGGNQQKVVFAKSLLTEPSVLLLDEPTVGIDVEAKSEVACLIREIADQGNGVVMISSEMDEMARLCDRVIILQQGRIHDMLDRMAGDDLSEQALSEAIQA